MKSLISFPAFLLPVLLFAQLQYPATKKVDTINDYHGQKVADPYRWLEDDNSEETRAWVVAENKVTQDYFDKIPYREKIKKRLTEMWNYPRYGSPFRKEGYYYFSKNDGLQNQSPWYRQKDLTGKPEIFLVRLRKAYTLFTWTKTKLLIGQTWHPFWDGDAFPRIGALNTGTPFQPFNRSPQVRLDYKTGAFIFSATGLYQQQYVSVGPIGASNTYKRDAVIPETVLSFESNGQELISA